jgi:hypothetical protein
LDLGADESIGLPDGSEAMDDADVASVATTVVVADVVEAIVDVCPLVLD